MEQVKGRVLIHTLIFPPDQVSTSYLYGDIAKALIDQGYEVDVITTYPHYNYSSNFKEVSKQGFLCRRSNFQGARVFHVKQKKSKTLIVRGAHIILFHLFFLLKAIFIRKFDFVLTPSPPLTAGLLSGLVAKLRGAKAIYNVQEIYPDVMIKQGGLKSVFLLNLLSRIEKWTYESSDKVVTIDNHFSEVIEDRLDKSKLECIPNFIDTKLYSPYKGDIPQELIFDNQFLVGYVGNLGKVQDWEAVIKAAEICQSEQNMRFLIVGGGSEFNYLKEQEKRLINWTVWPYQSREKIPIINSRINLHIISMNAASDYDGLPSKVFAILSSGKPIIAATNSDSPLARIVKASGNGEVVKRHSSTALAEGIQRAQKGHFTEEMSITGRQFVIENYSREKITSEYAALLGRMKSLKDS
ncbi:glycosyltransferase family 4 protein [Roseivirga thermotolerans]|uniref:glycosyltransferase family 4 protein n=1 Tax=Roseivirga thermotolerans TaxID=1758176 RepID=UPI00273DFD05|nr:glycosyltransferase family 4 protein [Roseivirga thermotolerans]